MSAYCELKTVFKDEKILIESLEALGFTNIENHLSSGKKSALVGYAHEPTVYADIVVRAQNGMYKDFGFTKQADGSFTANINDMNESHYNKTFKTPLANTYATKALQAKAKKLGLRVSAQPKKVGNKMIFEYVQV